ncbi:uncharacterized protein LOC111278837 isoform X3 [Durio zibethinus]|uniref:Uncharacterized protein LOC111278837 isoform X3 n=1 Tax=Durio zibethinus TaxID=66656 RepID=A0A6P5WYN5_DURZI|nr:uncharacterized protein LOC111278837 isoform X3 [Durio zibethinus]
MGNGDKTKKKTQRTYMCLGGSSRERRQMWGEDVIHLLKVSLEDLYLGTSKMTRANSDQCYYNSLFRSRKQIGIGLSKFDEKEVNGREYSWI